MDRPSLQQQIFISYSREPEENSKFAHMLAKVLRANGFFPWLDEEQIIISANFEKEIRDAIANSQHAIFIVTRRWLERAYTRMELNLFDKHPSDHRRVAVKREDFDEHELAPQLQQLNVITWRSGEPKPDACFWQIYCGLTETPPGPKDQWAKKGRELIARSEEAGAAAGPAPTHAPTHAPSGSSAGRVPCHGRPAQALLMEQGVFLLSETGECFRGVPDGKLERLPSLDSWAAAALTPTDVPAAGLYNSMAAYLRSGTWEFKPLDAPVLAVAATAQGVAFGDAAGTVTLFRGSGERFKSVPLGEPVIDLCACDQGLAALGAQGALARLEWTEDGAKDFERAPLPAGFGKPVGLFSVEKHRRADPVGVFSAERIAVYDGAAGTFTTGSRTFTDGIRTVVSLGRHPSVCGVLTDVGTLYLLESDLNTARKISLPDDSEVAGINAGAAGGLLAWTPAGTLFTISRDRDVRLLSAADVVLAYPDREHHNQIVIVCWAPGKGVQIGRIGGP